MMMNEGNEMIIEKFELPQEWAVAFVNSDLDSYSDEELEQIDAFEEYMLDVYGSCRCIDVSEDAWFSRYHDATDYGALACNVATFTFDVTPMKNSA